MIQRNMSKKLEDEGMQVNRLTDEQRTKFRQELEPMYEKYEEKFGEEILKLWKNISDRRV